MKDEDRRLIDAILAINSAFVYILVRAGGDGSWILGRDHELSNNDPHVPIEELRVCRLTEKFTAEDAEVAEEKWGS